MGKGRAQPMESGSAKPVDVRVVLYIGSREEVLFDESISKRALTSKKPNAMATVASKVQTAFMQVFTG